MRDFELLRTPLRRSEVDERCGLAMPRNSSGCESRPGNR